MKVRLDRAWSIGDDGFIFTRIGPVVRLMAMWIIRVFRPVRDMFIYVFERVIDVAVNIRAGTGSGVRVHVESGFLIFFEPTFRLLGPRFSPTNFRVVSFRCTTVKRYFVNSIPDGSFRFLRHRDVISCWFSRKFFLFAEKRVLIVGTNNVNLHVET